MSRSIDLPGFPGFYESRLSQITDWELERFAEYETEKQESAEWHPETYQPEHLRVDYGFAWEYVDYRKAELEIAKDYVTAFNDAFEDLIGFDPGLCFESIARPKFYNFSTDRLFCLIDDEIIVKLARIVRKDRYRSLAKVLAEHCTSRSGFHSHYGNEWKAFARKPLEDLDHNELALLLRAALLANGCDDALEDECVSYCEEASGSNGDYIDDAMDWPALEARADLERDKLREALPDGHPDKIEPHYRCSLTLELPFAEGARS